MSAPYHMLLRQVALRAGALKGENPTGIETSYLAGNVASALTYQHMNPNSPYPFDQLCDVLLQAEEDFVQAIATTGNHPWRAFIGGVTSSLAHQAVLPSLSSASKQIVGSWGTIYDASDNNPLVEKPLNVILRRVRNANSHYLTPVYFYKIDGRRIYHTRTDVVIEVCVYDRQAQATALVTNGFMLLPDVLDAPLVARACSYLSGLKEAEKYRRYSDEALMGIKAGLSSIPSKSIPVPITETRAA